MTQPSPVLRSDARSEALSAADSLFLIGAQKAGSTYLHSLMTAAAPELAEGRVKEVHYYSSARRHRLPLEDVFPEARPGQLRIDSSTSYLHNPETAATIQAAAGSAAPVILVFRDPVQRILSAYMHQRKHGAETRPLAEVLDLPFGDYETLRALEIERATRAFAQGRIILRKPDAWPDDLDQADYDNPMWNYLYISNSFYAAQSSPFRHHFNQVIAISMEEVIRTPQAVLAALSRRLDLALPMPEGPMKQNTTRYLRKRVLRKFWHNHRTAGVSPTRVLPMLRGGLSLLAGPGVPPEAADRIRQAPWYAALEADYDQIRALAISV